MKISDLLSSNGHSYHDVDFTTNQASISSIIKTCASWLIKNDFATQSLIGRYIDSRFETLHTQINPLDFRDKSTRDSLVRQIVGWSDGQQIRFDTERLDETIVTVALAASLNSGPASPGDVTMHTFRIYDVFRLLSDKDLISGGSLSGSASTNPSLLWLRYRYVKFVSERLSPLVKDVSSDRIITSLFAMPLYQFLPCLITAFRLYERNMDTTTISFAYPVLDPRDWTDADLDFLLEETKLIETPEWLKLVPLFDDPDDMLQTRIGHTSFSMPMHMDLNSDAEFVPLKLRHYLPICSSMTFAIFDAYEDTMLDGIALALGVKDLSKMEGYVDSFHVAMKGYFLAAEDLQISDSLADIWKSTVLPNLVDALLSNFKGTSEFRLSPAGSEGKVQLLFPHLTGLLLQNEKDMFTPVLDLTSRRILLSAQIRKNERTLPLFYTFSSGGKFLYTDE